MFKQLEDKIILISLATNHMNNEYIGNPCNISCGMFGIRYSYSDHYYATNGEDRGCSSTDGTLAFNASQGRRSSSEYLGTRLIPVLSTTTSTITADYFNNEDTRT